MKLFSTPRLLLTCCLVFLASCSTLENRTIAVGLRVELTGITRTANGDTEVSWRLGNPNIVPYLLAETTHRIFLNGALVGELKNREAIAVPAQSSIEGTVRLVPAGAAAERVLNEALAAGSATYRTETELVIRLYGDETDKGKLIGSGTVKVTAK
jgi:LEA14-like dessication related protein